MSAEKNPPEMPQDDEKGAEIDRDSSLRLLGQILEEVEGREDLSFKKFETYLNAQLEHGRQEDDRYNKELEFKQLREKHQYNLLCESRVSFRTWFAGLN